MNQPETLKTHEPLVWSTGRGRDVWELFCACVSGDVPAVERLLQLDPSLVRCQYAYRTPLYFAVRENQLGVARLLLGRGADALSLAVNDSLLDICRDRGYVDIEQLLTAHYTTRLNASPRGEAVAAAIRAHDVAEVRSLLDASPELLHVGDERSNQPIHWATMTRQLDMIDELLARGADIEAVRFDGARPIQLNNGDYHFRGWRDVPSDWPVTPADVISRLRARGAYLDMCTACHIGDIARARELLAEDASLANRLSDCITYYQCSGAPLKNAAAKGHLKIVRLLVDHGADPNLAEEGIAPHGHALYAAAAGGYHEIARLLLEHGAYPNPEVESSADALSRAISNQEQAMIELLCSYGAARAVHLLAYDGDVRTAAAVFAANPALADDPEALANAASQGHESFMRLMLRYQRDLPRRLTFPAWAVGAKSPALNELLFQHGMDPSQPDWLLITPLHQFARKGNIESARKFLDHGANLEARDEDICSTPLGWAAKFGQREMAELLLERGAKTNLPDDPPWATPLAWATRRGKQELVTLLQSCGAH
ncbi:MAG: ankyrin repeat domain-containing protein [Pirellulales bacterium]